MENKNKINIIKMESINKCAMDIIKILFQKDYFL